MSTATLERTLTTVDLTPSTGTEVKIDAETLASGKHAAELRRLLELRGVLVFKQINLTNAQQIAFSKSIGIVVEQGDKGIQPLSMDKKVNPIAEYQRSAIYWHIDGACDGVPNFAAMLNARSLPPWGGDTLFANTYAAWEALPADEREKLKDLKVVHSFEQAQKMVVPQPTLAELEGWRAMRSPKVQPLVWTHRDGRQSLVLGGTAARVQGMDVEDGVLLLTRLLDWATQDRFVYRHKWTLGDLVVWDNTGTMHRVDPYDFDSGRLLYRTTLEGEESLSH